MDTAPTTTSGSSPRAGEGGRREPVCAALGTAPRGGAGGQGLLQGRRRGNLPKGERHLLRSQACEVPWQTKGQGAASEGDISKDHGHTARQRSRNRSCMMLSRIGTSRDRLLATTESDSSYSNDSEEEEEDEEMDEIIAALNRRRRGRIARKALRERSPIAHHTRSKRERDREPVLQAPL